MRRATIGLFGLAIATTWCAVDCAVALPPWGGMREPVYGVGYEWANDHSFSPRAMVGQHSPSIVYDEPSLGMRLGTTRTGLTRQEIRGMPLLERPYRFGHFYGNNVRRMVLGHP